LAQKKLAEHLDRDILGLVLNSVRKEQSEVERDEIKDLVGAEIIGEVPDHKHVREGIALREPVVSYKPKSEVSHSIKDVAHRVRGEQPPERDFQSRFVARLQSISPF